MLLREWDYSEVRTTGRYRKHNRFPDTYGKWTNT